MNKSLAFLLFVFITQSVFADMTCDTGISKYFAFYEIDTYNCAPGYYLPANIDGCRACPTGWTCPGGTYTFNTDEFQGLELGNIETNTINNICAANFPERLNVFCKPNQHTCLPGYYLPANIDECTICPVGNKCPGGTLTFNETTPQGITACPNGTYAPTGSAICYEHILHVGEDVVYLKSDKLTTPSLNIGMDDGIFYANMTTEPTLMNRDSEHYLKLEYNNTVYYVCDDTTCGE